MEMVEPFVALVIYPVAAEFHPQAYWLRRNATREAR